MDDLLVSFPQGVLFVFGLAQLLGTIFFILVVKLRTSFIAHDGGAKMFILLKIFTWRVRWTLAVLLMAAAGFPGMYFAFEEKSVVLGHVSMGLLGLGQGFFQGLTMGLALEAKDDWCASLNSFGNAVASVPFCVVAFTNMDWKATSTVGCGRFNNIFVKRHV